MYIGMTECRIPFSGHCVLELELWPCFFLNNCIRCIPLIFFEVGIPNLVCECVLL